MNNGSRAIRTGALRDLPTEIHQWSTADRAAAVARLPEDHLRIKWRPDGHGRGDELLERSLLSTKHLQGLLHTFARAPATSSHADDRGGVGGFAESTPTLGSPCRPFLPPRYEARRYSMM